MASLCAAFSLALVGVLLDGVSHCCLFWLFFLLSLVLLVVVQILFVDCCDC